MKIDFSKYCLKEDCFSDKRGLIVEPELDYFVRNLMNVTLIESGPRDSKNKWQLNQLNNVLDFSRENSSFWKERLGDVRLQNFDDLLKIPELTRQDLKIQFEAEGSLLKEEEVFTKATSGSSGNPVIVSMNGRNSEENFLRHHYALMMRSTDVTRNSLLLWASFDIPYPGFIEAAKEYNMNKFFRNFFKSGEKTVIKYANPDLEQLTKKIKEYKCKVLICNPYLMESLINYYPVDEMVADGLETWEFIGGSPSQYVIDCMNKNNVQITGDYQSEELGLIGYACPHTPFHYHIASTNVYLEAIDEGITMNGQKMGKILVSCVQGYSTPIIRYENGDIATLLDKCPCGHDGQTITNIHGRTKNLIKRKDGTVFPFLIQVKNHPILEQFKEFRFTQTEIDKIKIEVSGKQHLSSNDINLLSNIVYDQAGRDMKVEIELVDSIDWVTKKRIPFKSLVL